MYFYLFLSVPTDEAEKDTDKDVRVKRSVCLSYTVMLLLMVARYSETVDWLEKYGAKLLAFSEQGRSLLSLLAGCRQK